STVNLIGMDAVCAYDYLVKQGYSAERIVLYGESLGGGLNAEILAKRKARAVITDSTFTDLLSAGRERIPVFWLYPPFLLPSVRLNVRYSISSLPALIIHGKKDINIPVHNAYDIHAAAPNSKLVVLANS